MSDDSFDRLEEELVERIKKEKGEKEKGILLLLYKISTTIEDNSKQIGMLSVTLQECGDNIKEYKAVNLEYINKGKGAWKVLLIVLGIFHGLLVSGMSFAYLDYKDVKQRIAEVSKINKQNTVRHK